MGLRVHYIKFIEKSIEKANLEEKKLNMVELGNQEMRNTQIMLDLYKEKNIKRKNTGKEFFTACGFNHTSIDLNGKNGALKKNLAKPIKDKHLLDAFDVLTNSGTSEHVKNQYECFKNCHNLCKSEAVMIHIVPQIGSWLKHGDFWYTNKSFNALAEKCNYEVLFNELIFSKPTALVAVALKKNMNSVFLNEEEFKKIFK